MPDRRRHRGPHPSDADLFASAEVPRLRQSADDLAWLLGRGYAPKAALALVGDRHGLRRRQRLAVLRSTASAAACAERAARCRAPAALGADPLWIDGYNLLITLEAALAGGVLLLGRDGCLRDLASLHGHFKRVAETDPALDLLGGALRDWGTGPVTLLLDRPVGNSGRLAARIRTRLGGVGRPLAVRLLPSPDRELRRAPGVVATADSAVLDACGPWVNLAREIVARDVPQARWIDFEHA